MDDYHLIIMCMGWNADWVLSEFIIEETRRRIDDISENMEEIECRIESLTDMLLVGNNIAHIPSQSLDLLIEARITYIIGCFQSSIYCAASLIDGELKRQLICYGKEPISFVEKETFGQSLVRMKNNHNDIPVVKYVSELEFINRIRNSLSIHSQKGKMLLGILGNYHHFVDAPPDLIIWMEIVTNELLNIQQKIKISDFTISNAMELINFEILELVHKIIIDGDNNHQVTVN